MSHIQGNPQVRQKIDLIHEIKQKQPQYREILDFFEPIIIEREYYKSALLSTLDISLRHKVIYDLNMREGVPLLAKKDIEYDNQIIKGHLTRLYQLIRPVITGSEEIVEDLIHQNGQLESLVNDNLTGETSTPDDAVLSFLVNETLNPILEIYADNLKRILSYSKWEKGFCPVCGKPPSLAVLEGETGKRFLICYACMTQWAYRRLKCPFCGNDDHQTLSYLFVEHDEKYRIELCERCKHYLKTIDLRKVGPPIHYDIEHIISLHLDMIAQEKGYIPADLFASGPLFLK